MSVLSFVRSVGAARSYPHLDWPDGLAERSTDLSVPVLRSAYAKGFYLSCETGRQTWCAPEMRMLLSIENFHIEPAVRRRLARKDFRVTFDQDSVAVIHACAATRAGRMDEDIIAAFISAFDAGLAHSVEIWDRSGVLAGGIFGLASAGSSSPRVTSPGREMPPKSASPRSTAICSVGAISSIAASISPAAYASLASCLSSGRPSTRFFPWPAQEPGRTDAGRSIRPLTLLPGIRRQ